MTILECADTLNQLINNNYKQDYSKGSDNKIPENISKEVENLETQMASVCGKGGEKKKGTKLTDEKKMKSAFNDICTVDSLVNLFRCTDYLDVMKNHDLCNHVEKCSAITNIKSYKFF